MQRTQRTHMPPFGMLPRPTGSPFEGWPSLVGTRAAAFLKLRDEWLAMPKQVVMERRTQCSSKCSQLGGPSNPGISGRMTVREATLDELVERSTHLGTRPNPRSSAARDSLLPGGKATKRQFKCVAELS